VTFIRQRPFRSRKSSSPRKAILALRDAEPGVEVPWHNAPPSILSCKNEKQCVSASHILVDAAHKYLTFFPKLVVRDGKAYLVRPK